MPFLQAIRCPILVRYNTVIKSLAGSVFCLGGPFSFQIGFGNIAIFDKRFSRSILDVKGKITVNGNVYFGHGCKISIGKKGHLIIGNNTINTAEMTIVCHERIEFGKGTLISWDTLIIDTDFHHVVDMKTGEINCLTAPVKIDNNSWLCSRSVILKGTYIPEGSIVGSNALVNKKFTEPNILIAGNPASIKRHNISRKFQ